MRHLSILVLVLFTLSFTAMPLQAGDDTSHACAKAEKICCQKDAQCCKEAKACCTDVECCQIAADDTHTCTMKHADDSACASMSCCKEKACDVKKTS